MDFYLAKHGLSKTWDLRPKIGLILKKTNRRERREKERRRRRGREEEEKKRSSSMVKKGMDSMILVWIYGILRLSMGNGLSQKLGF